MMPVWMSQIDFSSFLEGLYIEAAFREDSEKRIRRISLPSGKNFH